MNADEIVKGLQVEITCENCPHNNLHESECFTKGCYFVNAAALIESLQSQLAKEKRRAEKALGYIKKIVGCDDCVHDDTNYETCKSCNIYDKWQWRGDVAEEGDAE